MNHDAAWAEAPPEICAAALAGVTFCKPERLRALLDLHSPREAVLRLLDPRCASALSGDLAMGLGAVRAWRDAIRRAHPTALRQRLDRERAEVWLRDHPSYPHSLVNDLSPPAVLFARGDPTALNSRLVAIIGTRRATAYGRGFATKLGADLTDAGVGVVSGLAVGIDGAAHEGVIAVGGRPVGVVGSGLDVVYPRRHGALWQRVGDGGLLLSEAGLGAAPEAWRFPARNRIIAALAQAVIVVESGEAGGSQLTVEAAIARGVPVMAVPGPVGSAASAGTNRLLVDGAAPVLGADEVLLELGLTTSGPVPLFRVDDAGLSTDARTVLDALDFVPTPTERLVATTLSPGRVAVALEELKGRRLATGGGGWWTRVP